jgi:DNA-binding NtrC family response regulator
MAITVVLAVGWDTWLLAAQNSAWREAGYIAVSTSSITEAFQHFKGGDFDLVLLGSAISRQERETLTRQIRETGAKAPVIDTADLPDNFKSLKDAVSRVTANPIPVSAVKLPPKKTFGRLAAFSGQ